MSTVRFAPMVVIQPGVIIDDGTDLAPGPPLQPVQVPLADLRGSKFYDDLLGQLAQLQAQVDDTPQTPVG